MRWPARGRTFGTAIATASATEHTSSPARLWRARRKGSISIVRTSTADPSGYRERGSRDGVKLAPDTSGISLNIPDTGRPRGRPVLPCVFAVFKLRHYRICSFWDRSDRAQPNIQRSHTFSAVANLGFPFCGRALHKLFLLHPESEASLVMQLVKSRMLIIQLL